MWPTKSHPRGKWEEEHRGADEGVPAVLPEHIAPLQSEHPCWGIQAAGIDPSQAMRESYSQVKG